MEPEDIFYKILAESFRYGFYVWLFIFGFGIGHWLDVRLSFGHNIWHNEN